jgi:hypothetical protein
LVFIGGCFAVGCSSISLGWILCHHNIVYCVGHHL